MNEDFCIFFRKSDPPHTLVVQARCAYICAFIVILFIRIKQNIFVLITIYYSYSSQNTA